MKSIHAQHQTAGLAPRLFLALGACLVLFASSCSQKVNIVLEAEVPGLRPALASLATEYSRQSRLKLELAPEGSLPSGPALVVAWRPLVPGAASPSRPIALERIRKGGFASAFALEGLEGGEASWQALPLLIDVWGLSIAGEDPAKAKLLDPSDLARLAKAGGPILAPGAEAGTRQALFWLSSKGKPRSAFLASLVREPSASPEARSLYASFVALEKSSLLHPDSLRFRQADVDNLLSNAGKTAVYGAYSAQRTLGRTGPRAFRPLGLPLGEGGYGMAVAVLEARIWGESRAATGAEAFALWLLEPGRQKRLGEATGLLAANFNSPNLDVQAALARDLAIRAQAFLPVDPGAGRGQAQPVWQGVLDLLVARPLDWEAALPASLAASPGKQ